MPPTGEPGRSRSLGRRLTRHWETGFHGRDGCGPEHTLIVAGDAYLVDGGMADVLSPCAPGAALRLHTSVVAPATLHEGRGRQALAAGLEVLAAQAVQRDLGDLRTEVMETASRRLAGL